MLRKITSWSRKKSPWAYHLACGGSCNGCEIEVVACLTPRYDLERFGVLLKGSPRHADVLLITGILTKRAYKNFLKVYNQVPEPKVVVAIGVCAIHGGPFSLSYNSPGNPKDKIPVDIFIPGCPPRPEAIIHGLAKALEKLGEK